MTQKIPALLPMKAHSERVPGKNLRPLGGRPLFRHVLGALLEARHIERVYIDTDSPEIAALVGELPRVCVIDRPTHLCGDDVPMTDILAHDLATVTGEVILQTHATNPFLNAATIDRAIEAFWEAGERDALASMTPLHTRLYWPDARPINHDPARLERTQDLPPVYEENSNIYVFRRASLLTTKRRFGSDVLFFEMDPLEALDIDTEADFAFAEFLVARGKPTS